MTLLAPVCASLGDARRAELLYGLLAPYGDRNALSVPDVAAGAVARSLGVLAAATGRREEASGHYEDALAMNERLARCRGWRAPGMTTAGCSRPTMRTGPANCCATRSTCTARWA